MIRRLLSPLRPGRPGDVPPAERRAQVTWLFRNQPQLEVLVRAMGPPAADASVLIWGVADGCEAVSLVGAVGPGPEQRLAVHGFDHDPAYVAAARRGRYLPEQLRPPFPRTWARRVLEEAGDGVLQVRPEHLQRLSFDQGDLRELSPDAPRTHDVVLCQNTLVFFEPKEARAAVRALAARVAPGGLLVVGGGHLDVVPPAVLAAGFDPVLDAVEEVHEGWWVQRGFWANANPPCWALEPFDGAHPGGPARYCTVFRNGA